MIKIENTDVNGFEAAIRGMRNPMNSWDNMRERSVRRMTLTDAINHLKESLADPTHKWGCEECKQEHEQLLAWLEEYHKIKEYWLPSDEEELRKERGECNNLYDKIDIVVSGLYSAIADQIVENIGLANKYKRLEAECIDLDNRLRTANTENDELRYELKQANEIIRFQKEKFDRLSQRYNQFAQAVTEKILFEPVKLVIDKETLKRMKLIGGDSNDD